MSAAVDHKSPFFFLFNPFTRVLIKLPRFERTFYNVAFSCAPTSAEFVIFNVKHISSIVVAISTCYPGANEWTAVNHQSPLGFCH
jgi:hypothetical protein